MERLLQGGALVQAVDEAGRTPLHLAVINGHPGAVRLLLRHGADPRSRDDEGNAPRGVAFASGHDEVVELLGEED